METRTSQPLLDLVGTGELARALRERGDRGWEPEVRHGEGARRRPSLKRALKFLPWVMLPLGLLAVAGLVAALRAMAVGDSPDGMNGWLRFGLLVMSVAFIGSQVWRLASKTRLARRLVSRFEPKKARAAAPVLDAVSLGALRGAMPEGWGDAGRRELAEARARRFAGSASWWALAGLALALSAGIVALMVGLAAWELADGREAGPWLVVPLFAAGFAGIGFWMSLRTALRSRKDVRQRRRGRLFRRVLGYIARGHGGGGSGGRTGSLASNAGGSPGTGVAGLAANIGGGVGQVFGAGMMAAGSVAVLAGDAMGPVPGRLSKVDGPGAPVGWPGFAAFAVASVAVVWAGFGWPGGEPGGVGDGAPLVSSVETPKAEASATLVAGGETPTPGDDDDDLPLAAAETPTPSMGEVLATVVPPGGAGDSLSGGTNPPAGATPGGGGLSGGQGAAPTSTPTSTATATNTPVPPTATATATATATPTVQPVGPSPTAEPSDPPPTRTPAPPTRTPAPPKKPTLTPTPKPGGPPNSAIPTPTPTKVGGFSIGGGGSN